jgi:hypothetical protein
MLTKTDYTVDPKFLQEAYGHLPPGEMKKTINQPTGDFFYDPWVIKDEYRGTVWETLYDSLPIDKGEARILILDTGHCYQSHADIDDRYHLTVMSEQSYLINLDTCQMYKLEVTGDWYCMDTSPLHTATNFGRCFRVQLVVRKLLLKNKLENPVKIKITYENQSKDDSRFVLDNVISPWLNSANKNGFISNFCFNESSVEFNIEKDNIVDLQNRLPSNFIIHKHPY